MKKITFVKIWSFLKEYWLLEIIIVLFVIAEVYHDFIEPNFIAEKISHFNLFWLIFIFFVIATVRIFALIPHTTFVILATLLFKDRWLIWALAVLTHFTSNTILFFFAEKLKIDKLLKKKFSDKISFVQQKLQKYFWFILIFWTFVPVMSNDLLTYICSIMKIDFFKYSFANTFFHAIFYFFIIWGLKSIL